MPTDVGEVQDQEARLAAVEEAEAVTPLLHDLEWPGIPIDHDAVAEELGIPNGREAAFHPALRNERPHDGVEELARVRIEQRTVGVERPILDGDRDLVIRLVRRELVVGFRGGAGQDGRQAGPAVEHRGVAVGSATHDVESGGPGIDIEPGQAQGVIVIPDCGSPVRVRVFEDRVARPPGGSEVRRGLAGEEVIPRAPVRVARRNVRGRGQIPRLGIAVALIAHPDRPMDMGDHRHGARVAPGRRLAGEVRTRVAVHDAAGRIGPMQGRVHRQQVGEVVPVGVHEFIDPLDADGAVGAGLDGQGGGVVDEEAGLAFRLDRAVAPDGGGGQSRRQDLLLELPHRDFVIVHLFSAPLLDDARPGHDRRDEQRRLVLGNAGRLQRASRDGGQGPGQRSSPRQEQAGAGDPHHLDELSAAGFFNDVLHTGSSSNDPRKRLSGWPHGSFRTPPAPPPWQRLLLRTTLTACRVWFCVPVPVSSHPGCLPGHSCHEQHWESGCLNSTITQRLSN